MNFTTIIFITAIQTVTIHITSLVATHTLIVGTTFKMIVGTMEQKKEK